ncbi:UPF0728 protein C10orf53 homolog [Alligator sinensis]|uniref:UPF0728 protein C10orf53 homolog n=1 Tax=Alligator sinensis TaxID=38654 RepID=A0A3Q0H8H8_ALLSI|nr:UPF0728 protein C10orf53 homolog [Alligator sinensis]
MDRTEKKSYFSMVMHTDDIYGWPLTALTEKVQEDTTESIMLGPCGACRRPLLPAGLGRADPGRGHADCVQTKRGRRAVLEADGHQVILEEMPDWNVVELVVNGETVFQCNIKDLDFGGDGKLDPLCEEARVAVLNAY